MDPLLSLASNLVVAYFVYLLARHQFRSNRWWERQERAYSSVLNELAALNSAARRLAEHERALIEEDDPGPRRPTYPQAELQEFVGAVQRGRREIQKQVERGPLLLSELAVRVLSSLLHDLERVEGEDFHQYHLAISTTIANHYNEFREIALFDVGAPGTRRRRVVRDYRERLEDVREELDRLLAPPK